MSSKYTTSIISKYGDAENVKTDGKAVIEILSRQGTSFAIDMIAEYVGTIANTYKATDDERRRLLISLSEEFKNAIQERL